MLLSEQKLDSVAAEANTAGTESERPRTKNNGKGDG